MKNDDREIVIFNDIEDISNFAVKKWRDICDKALKNKNYFEVALSGGKTPMALYKRLAEFEETLPWNKTRVFFVDERFVPFEHSESNYRMVNHVLFNNIDIPRENIHSIPTKENNPRVSAMKYEEDLISSFKLAQGQFPQFDLILLGMGEDGHTASLFPGTPSLQETKHLSVAVSPSDLSLRERISLTLPVINNAVNIIFLIAGRNKAKVIKDVLEDGTHELPAAMVKPEKGKLLFLIDERAASLISIIKNN
ncbi:MAG: 6-phosphogluconolactonase [Thermodesulfovibrionia bacterium]|nr:6-phosphogluconolactonase [Thermodesulfovibrionia bacterium]